MNVNNELPHCDGLDPQMPTRITDDAEYEDAFIIIDLPEREPLAGSKPEPKDEEPAERRRPSDEMYSRNARIDFGVACAEPIYKDGKPTGEYRICRRPRHWDDTFWKWTKELPWEGVVHSRQEAFAWLKQIRDSC